MMYTFCVCVCILNDSIISPKTLLCSFNQNLIILSQCQCFLKWLLIPSNIGLYILIYNLSPYIERIIMDEKKQIRKK